MKYEEGRADEAMYLVSEAMSICTEMKYEEGRAAAMNVIAKVHVKKGVDDEEELEEAMDSANDALKLFRKLGYRKGEAVALSTLSSVYTAGKKAAPAIKSAKEALTIFAELGEKKSMAETYHLVKDAYLVKTPAESFLAAKQVSKAAALYQELGDKVKEAGCLHTVATIEKTAGDTKKAADSLQKSLDLFSAAFNLKGQLLAMATMMDMLAEGDMYFEAVKVAKKRVSLASASGDTVEEGLAMMKLGEFYLKNGDHAKAEKIAEAALGVFGAASMYAEMGQAKELADGAKHAKAVEEIETSLEKAKCSMHVPGSIIVDPGLNKRVNSTWGTAIRTEWLAP